jgi:hypothetical protein
MPEGDPRRFRKQAEESVNRQPRRIAREGNVAEWMRLRNPPKKEAGNNASVRPSSRVNSLTPIAYGRLAEDTADLVLFAGRFSP